MSHSFESITHTGIALLALATRNAIPQSRWMGDGIRGKIFFCDFYIPNPQDFKIVEEQIQQALRKLLSHSQEINVKEMVKSNALEYLKFRGGLWSESKQTQDVVSLLEIADQSVLCKQPLATLNEETTIRLWKIEQVPDSTIKDNWIAVRLYGYALLEKSALPEMKSYLTEIESKDHISLGESLSLFLAPQSETDEWIWLPKGIAWKKALLEKYTKWDTIEGSLNDSQKIAIQYATRFAEKNKALPPAFSQIITRQKKSLPFESAWKLYDSPLKTELIVSSFCEEKDLLGKLISSLQMIEKTYNMLEVEHTWVWRLPRPKGYLNSVIWNKRQKLVQQAISDCRLTGKTLPSEDRQLGPKVELCVIDSFDKLWTIAHLTLEDIPYPETKQFPGKGKNIASSMSYVQIKVLELEMLTGVLLEKYSKGFPLWIAPEQLRIVPASETEINFCLTVSRHAQKLGIRSFIDKTPESVKKKVQKARREKVPCIVTIGKEQVDTHTVLPENLISQQEKPINWLEFLETLCVKIEASMQERPTIEE